MRAAIIMFLFFIILTSKYILYFIIILYLYYLYIYILFDIFI